MHIYIYIYHERLSLRSVIQSSKLIVVYSLQSLLLCASHFLKS